MLSERPAALTRATASSSCCLLTVTPVQVHPVFCTPRQQQSLHLLTQAHCCMEMIIPALYALPDDVTYSLKEAKCETDGQ